MKMANHAHRKSPRAQRLLEKKLYKRERKEERRKERREAASEVNAEILTDRATVINDGHCLGTGDNSHRPA
jgi:hypothetical protein